MLVIEIKQHLHLTRHDTKKGGSGRTSVFIFILFLRNLLEIVEEFLFFNEMD